jgi:DNA integrity scanning protein DisA with diadenylate cyclase activity
MNVNDTSLHPATPAASTSSRSTSTTQRDRQEFRPREWWKEPPEAISNLSPHIVDKLVAGGFNDIQSVREAGPLKLMEVEGIGRVALEEIRTWLRSLDDGGAD